MKFQLQQKGLFTFYKEQQQFQEEIALIKHKQNQKAETEKKIQANTKFKEQQGTRSLSKKKKINRTSKQEKTNQLQKTQSAMKFKKYGEAVMIINRKETQQTRQNEIKYENSGTPTSKDQGYFVQNKQIEFDTPLREGFRENKARQTLNRRKICFVKKREDSVFQSKRYQKQQERSRLPTITRVQSDKKSTNPATHRKKISGSLLRSNGSDLLKKIRSNALNISQNKKQIKSSVSYIQYSNEYSFDSQVKKKDKLSPQQRKLLQILSQYRKSDF